MCHHPKRFSEDCVDFNMHEEKEIKESEKPMQKELEKEINKFRIIFKNECDACIIGEIANHFAEWGAIHFNARKEE